MLYSADSKGPYKVAGVDDPDSIRTFSIILRPPTRANSTVYYIRSDDDYDIVIPDTFTGVYYKVKSPGLSAATPPTFSTEVGSETVDGSVVWEAVAYNLLPPSIDVSTVTFSATNGATVSNTGWTTTQCQFTKDSLPGLSLARSLLTYNVAMHIVLSDGDAVDMTVKFSVAER